MFFPTLLNRAAILEVEQSFSHLSALEKVLEITAQQFREKKDRVTWNLSEYVQRAFNESCSFLTNKIKRTHITNFCVCLNRNKRQFLVIQRRQGIEERFSVTVYFPLC